MHGGGCGERPLSSVHIRITEVGMMNRSGSEVTEELALVSTHIVESIHCGDCPCCSLPSGAESKSLCGIIAGNIWKHMRWCLNSVSDSPFQQSLQSRLH